MENQNNTNNSVWKLNTHQSTFPVLQGTMQADVAIIGGGITGITAALLLSQAGLKTVVLEAWHIGNGTTGNSTGNLYAMVDERLYQIRKNFSEEIMEQVTVSRKSAVDYIEGIVSHFSLDCNFTRQPWHLITKSEEHNSEIEREFSAASKSFLNASLHETMNLPFPVTRALKVEEQAQFNPLQYVRQLAEMLKGKCSIHEYSKVEKIEEGDTPVVHTSLGKVIAKNIIMATHVPKGLLKVQAYLGPYREYGLAFRLKEGSYPPDGIFWMLSKGHHFSFRNYKSGSDHFLIVVGAPHKVGQDDPAEKVLSLEKFARDHFQVIEKCYQWSGQHYHSADGLPYIGEHKKNIFYGTGFATDGLVYGTLAAQIISDSILNHKNQFAEIYKPDRHNPLVTAGDAIKENINVAGQYLKDWPASGDVSSVNEIARGTGRVIAQDGEKIAVYKGINDEIKAVSAVCTHMQCIVNWNDVSKSWDCPCHGSRFDVSGKVLEGPAIADLAEKKIKPE